MQTWLSHIQVSGLSEFDQFRGAGAEREGGEKWRYCDHATAQRPLAFNGGGAAFRTKQSLLDVFALGFLSGIIRQNWNDTEKISMAPAQG